MTVFFGEQKLKDVVLNRLREHRRLDQIVQGVYWEEGRGCHLGCLTHVNEGTQQATERLFGIPERVAYWLEAVFEGLPADRCAWWVVASIEAMPAGADLSLAHHELAAWLLGPSEMLAIVDCNREAIERCRSLHVRAARGEAVTPAAWSAAESAAWSAAWEKIAVKSLEIFAAAPITGQQEECSECVTATFAHLRHSELVATP